MLSIEVIEKILNLFLKNITLNFYGIYFMSYVHLLWFLEFLKIHQLFAFTFCVCVWHHTMTIKACDSDSGGTSVHSIPDFRSYLLHCTVCNVLAMNCTVWKRNDHQPWCTKMWGYGPVSGTCFICFFCPSCKS